MDHRYAFSSTGTWHVLTIIIVSMRITKYKQEMKDYEQEDSKKAMNNVKIDSSWDDPEDSRLENERAVNSVS